MVIGWPPVEPGSSVFTPYCCCISFFLMCQRGGERSRVSSFPLNCGFNAQSTSPSVAPIEGVTCENIVLVVLPGLVAGLSPLGCKSRTDHFVGQECDVFSTCPI